MVVSSEEKNVLEQLAKFDGLKELLEDDVAETEPDEDVVQNVAANHPPFKQLYLELVVAYTKYKARFVPEKRLRKLRSVQPLRKSSP